MVVDHLILEDGTIFKQQEGHVAPYKKQVLFWLVPGKLAIGRWRLLDKDTQTREIWDGVEIFTAKKHKHAVCGFQFTYLYNTTYPISQKFIDYIGKYHADTRTKEGAEELVAALTGFTFEDKEPIDRSWKCSRFKEAPILQE